MKEKKNKAFSSSPISMKDSTTSTEDLVEEREELMVLPSENSKKSHLLKPCFTISIDGSEAVVPIQNISASSPSLKVLSFSVSFNGWRWGKSKFKSWATKMAALHEPTWRKAGIFEAVMASTDKIVKDADLVLGIAEKWCPNTKTFVFPWGETTITLEDVTVLLGFSVLGSPVFAALDSSGEKIKEKLEKEWVKIKDKISFVAQATWMRRFMDSGDDELEHVAFLALWLSYFVFPSRYYHLYEAVLPIAVHLSCGTKIALAPPVLAHLYAELSLLKTHIRDFTKSKDTVMIDLNALFKLVQVWTWERFRELQPVPLRLREGEPRLARWYGLKQLRTIDVRRVLVSSKAESFEWRPYTKPVENWEFPKFYPEKAMLVPVDTNLDDEFISFARCIKVCELVGIDSVEHYFPNRVASQFGMVQDIPVTVSFNSLSREAAWDDYEKPIDDLTLFIPSRSATPRVTPMFCEWWRKEKNVVESAETLKPRNIIGHGDTFSFVASGSKMSRTRGVGIKIAEDSTKKKRKCIKRARDKRRKYMKRAGEDGSKMKKTSEDGVKIAKDSIKKRRKYMKKRARENGESTMGCCQTQVSSDNDEEDVSITIAQIMRIAKKKPLGKKSRLEADNNDSGPHQKPTSISAYGNEAVEPPEIEQRNQKNTAFDENNSSDPPLGFDEAIDIVVSPPETRHVDVNESNVEKMTMTDDGSKESECLFHKDGAMAGEKASSEEKEDDVADDDSLIQKKLALNADNNEPSTPQKLAYGGPNGDETSDGLNIHITVGDGTQGHDCSVHDTALGSEETMKSSDQLENNDSFEKSLLNVKVMASSIEERIIKAQRNVAWLKERRAIKQSKIAAARLI